MSTKYLKSKMESAPKEEKAPQRQKESAPKGKGSS